MSLIFAQLFTWKTEHPFNFFYKGKLVETETIGRVFLIGINRPEKRNAVNQETAVQLYEAIETFEKTEDLYAAVLYGKGL